MVAKLFNLCQYVEQICVLFLNQKFHLHCCSVGNIRYFCAPLRFYCGNSYNNQPTVLALVGLHKGVQQICKALIKGAKCLVFRIRCCFPMSHMGTVPEAKEVYNAIAYHGFFLFGRNRGYLHAKSPCSNLPPKGKECLFFCNVTVAHYTLSPPALAYFPCLALSFAYFFSAFCASLPFVRSNLP